MHERWSEVTWPSDVCPHCWHVIPREICLNCGHTRPQPDPADVPPYPNHDDIPGIRGN
jgi:hypothetical protein